MFTNELSYTRISLYENRLGACDARVRVNRKYFFSFSFSSLCFFLHYTYYTYIRMHVRTSSTKNRYLVMHSTISELRRKEKNSSKNRKIEFKF